MRGARAAVVLACAAFMHAAWAALPAPVAQALARAGVPASAVGAVVEPVAGGAALVSHRAREPMNPASVMKLATSYAALDVLGPAFAFHTDVLAAGEINAGVLEGDLVIRGGGDPSLTIEKLWLLAHRLHSRGLREVRGDVVIDRGYFAPAAHDPASFDNEPRRAYNAGPDAFLVNFGAVNFTFVPDGKTVRVVAEPDLPNIEIVSRIRAAKQPCGAWRRNLQYDVTEQGLLSTVVFDGSYPADCGERSWPLAVLAPARFTESAWRWVWSESGGVLRGKVREGAAPADARLLYRMESDPLADIVRDMNKYSNNVMARHLFLALSAERGAPGEARASEKIVRDWLAGKGVQAPELAIENGSGLARDDRVSAATLAALLRSAWASPLMPELAASLPVLSVDGTLRSRSAGAAGGHAHLKGGTLDGVQSLAGFVLDRDGRRWIVVMMINHPNANAAQGALDALAEWVYRGGRR